MAGSEFSARLLCFLPCPIELAPLLAPLFELFYVRLLLVWNGFVYLNALEPCFSDGEKTTIFFVFADSCGDSSLRVDAPWSGLCFTRSSFLELDWYLFLKARGCRFFVEL